MCRVLLKVLTKEYGYHTVPMGISSKIPLYDIWHSGSREIDWGVIHVEILQSDLGMMSGWMMFSEVVCKILSIWVPDFLQPGWQPKTIIFSWIVGIIS